MLLRNVIGRVAGRPFALELTDRLLAPLGLAAGMRFDGTAAALPASELNVSWVDVRGRPLPMLHVLCQPVRAAQDPAFGGWSTPLAFHEFLQACRRGLAGDEPLLSFMRRAGARSADDPLWRATVADSVLDRTVGFWCGFMSGVTPGEMPAPDSDDALLAVVGLAQGVGLVDPDRDLVASAFGDVMSYRPYDARRFRYAVLDEIYARVLS